MKENLQKIFMKLRKENPEFIQKLLQSKSLK